VGINVEIQHESGETIAEFLDPEGAITRLVVSQHENRHSICLRFIDPYGDTTFNQQQLPHLIAEVESAIRAMSDQVVKLKVARLSDFLKTAINMHTYVKFIGD
jgi:hypothetical protein